MKAYSGSTSEGFLPPTLSSATGAAATAVAPAPEDPSTTFADALDQQTPKPGAAFGAWGQATAADSSLGTAPSTPLTPSVATTPAATPLAPVTSPAPTSLTWTAPITTDLTTLAAGTTSPVTSPDVSTPTSTPSDAFSGPSDLSRPYTWLGQSGVATTPQATTPTGTGDTASAEESMPPQLPSSAPAQLFTAPLLVGLNPKSPTATTTPASTASASASTADTTPGEGDRLLSLYEWLSKPATPTTVSTPPTSTFPTTPAGSTPSDSASTTVPDRALSFVPFSWFSQRAAPTPASSPTLPSSNDADLTGAAIVDSVVGRGTTAQPALPSTITLPQQTATTPASTSGNASPVLSGSPLATIMAHAAILAANSKPNSSNTSGAVSSTATGTQTSSAVVFIAPQSALAAKPPATPAGLEKKSAASASERSFLQEKANPTSTSDTTSSLLQAALTASADLAGNQSVVTTSSTPATSSGSLSTAPISSAGMANGKKIDDMSSTLEMPSQIVSSGTNPLVMRTSADLHIALDTNHDFSDALKQVMHVAELSNMSRSTPPLRVAIEIQTPPGAIVNVYVSRQADSSYRAQLSTNDPQALSWVQNQISSLKGSTDTGSAIRWSPVQLEPGAGLSTSSSSTGSDRGYDWNRGGQQGQSGYQQDERNPRRRPLYADSDEPEIAFGAFSAVGGAA